MAELSRVVEAAPKGTGLDCEPLHDRPPQGVNHIRVTQLWAGKGRALGHISNGHNNGHTSQRICRRASANGQMSVSLLPSPGWPLPPLWWDSIPSWFGDPLGPTDRESDTPPDAGTRQIKVKLTAALLCV